MQNISQKMNNQFNVQIHRQIFLLLLLVCSCRKVNDNDNRQKNDVIIPPMEYYNDINQVIMQGGIGFRFDADLDQKPDLLFNTRLVGDPIQGVDKIQFFVLNYPGSSLPVDAAESVPKLAAGDSIPVANFRGYTWYRGSSVVLTEKIIGNGTSHWEGNWKDATHAFLPFMCHRANANYTGWVELSIDSATARLIVLRAAVCRQPEKTSYSGK
ncbi:MAG TPA: hypothetical protein VJ499_00840 [Flavisolibacter sp.]|nr:hypothetical protein [Flavisolibacter sp.]